MPVVPVGSVSVDTDAFLDGDLAPVVLDTATETVELVESARGATYTLSVAAVDTEAAPGVYRVTAAEGWLEVDKVTLTVSGEIDTVPTTQTLVCDVVGARLVTPAQAGVEARQSAAATSVVQQVLDRFLGLYEIARGTSPVPRLHVDRWTAASLPNAYRIPLTRMLASEVVSCTVDGTEVDVVLDGSTVVRTDGGLFCPAVPAGEVVVTYVYGVDVPSPSCRAAAVAYVRYEIQNLLGTSMGRTYESVSAEGYVFRAGSPDVSADRWSGYIDVDANLAIDPDHRVPVIA